MASTGGDAVAARVRDPAGQPAGDVVNRTFTADRPDRLWINDITEHPTGE